MLQILAKILGYKAKIKQQPPRRARARVGLEELEQRSLLSAVSAAATLTTTSSNWSGYAVETSLTTAQANSVSAVGGSWVVPTVTGNGNTYSAVWVGIDGYSSATVEQIGIEADTVNGKAVYSAWYEMYPSLPVTISTLTVQPGDAISAEVSYGSGKFTLQITDSTTGKLFSIAQSAASAQRSSAEWIVEAPSSGFGVLPIANFGTVNFSGAWATVDGSTGPIDSAAWQDALINMSSRSGLEDNTSAVTDSAITVGISAVTSSNFSVTYNATATQPTPPPPPPRRHNFFDTEVAVSQADGATGTSEIAAVAKAFSHITINTTTLVTGQQAVSEAAAEIAPTVPMPQVTGPAVISSAIVLVRPGADLDSSDNEIVEVATRAGDAGNVPPIVTMAVPAPNAVASVVLTPATLGLDRLPRSVVDSYFADDFVPQVSLDGQPATTADRPLSLEILWSIGMTAFVTDWAFGLASNESRKFFPLRACGERGKSSFNY